MIKCKSFVVEVDANVASVNLEFWTKDAKDLLEAAGDLKRAALALDPKLDPKRRYPPRREISATAQEYRGQLKEILKKMALDPDVSYADAVGINAELMAVGHKAMLTTLGGPLSAAVIEGMKKR
jgi:hypothetical protein